MSFFKTIGCVFLVALCLMSGWMKVQQPELVVPQIMKGNLPILIKNAGIAKKVPGFKFGDKEAKLLTQVLGGAMIGTSLMIIVNVGRRFGAFLLAAILCGITVCQHVNITDPQKTTQEQQIQAMKNLGIIGGLLVVLGSYDYEDVEETTTEKMKKD